MTQKESASSSTVKANRTDNANRNEKDNLAYLDDYLDTIEALPAELQRNFSLMRELDNNSQGAMETVARYATYLINHLQDLTPEQRKDELKKLGSAMNECLKNGEEKVSLATSTYDTVDRHIRRLDDDLQKFEDEQMTGPGRISATVAANASREDNVRNKATKSDKERKEVSRNDKRSHAQETAVNKRRKVTKEIGTPPPSTSRQGDKERGEKPKPKARRDLTKNQKSVKTTNKISSSSTSSVQPNDMPIDPNEPVYCYCQQVSYGEMVACDNSDCKIEWFHYPCVELKGPPKGKWYCKECTEKLKKQKR